MTLDIGGNMGFTYWRPGSRPFSGSINLKKPYQSLGDFFHSFRTWLLDLINVHNPAHIVYEAPFVKNLNAVDKLYGIKAHVEEICVSVGITSELVKPTTWQSHAFKGKKPPKGETKKWSVRATDELGFEIVCEHEADAVNILDWFAHKNKLKIDWPCGPLFKGENAA